MVTAVIIIVGIIMTVVLYKIIKCKFNIIINSEHCFSISHIDKQALNSKKPKENVEVDKISSTEVNNKHYYSTFVIIYSSISIECECIVGVY